MTTTFSGEIDAPCRQRSLSTYEGWKDFAERPPREKPTSLTPEQLGALGPDEFARYNAERRAWHANILLRTRQVHGVHLQLGDILDSNLQDSDRVKSAAALDAPPALGKSTVVNTFGRDFHRQRIAEVGEYLDEDRDILHLPVCHITVPGRLTIKGLHMMILGFYAHPATAGILHRSMAGRDLARAAADCIERHDTRLVIIDDLHFIQMRTRDGVEVANQLKWLSNEYSATFLFAGVALRERGLVGEGATGKEAAMAQTFRRWTVLSLDPYSRRPARSGTACSGTSNRPSCSRMHTRGCSSTCRGTCSPAPPATSARSWTSSAAARPAPSAPASSESTGSSSTTSASTREPKRSAPSCRPSTTGRIGHAVSGVGAA
ncbi:hypothetical protein GCM10023065_01770 [Microbacterium laevaniformans]|nr:hypothetical protein GCM10017578_28100 [Microbacterium laevaniformans]